MLAHLAGEIPRFFTLPKLVLLLEAMGTTLLMTAIGCVLGFLLAFGIVVLRQTPGWLALPLRLAAGFYVEIFRRIPFLVVIYLVLFFIQAFVSDASLFAIAVVAICIYSTAYTADIIRGGFESVARQHVEAAAAMNFSRWRSSCRRRSPSRSASSRIPRWSPRSACSSSPSAARSSTTRAFPGCWYSARLPSSISRCPIP